VFVMIRGLNYKVLCVSWDLTCILGTGIMCLSCRRSITKCYVFASANLMFVKNKKQSVYFQVSAKSKYQAMVFNTRDMI